MDVFGPVREDDRPFYWVLLIGITTVIAVVLTVYGLSSGYTQVYPHLYYLPIVIAAYRYPRKGTVFAVLLGMVYLISLFVYARDDLALLLAGVVRTLIFVMIGAIIAILSYRIRLQEERYQQIFNNSEAGVFLVKLANLAITEVNERGAEMLGTAPAALEGTRLIDFWPEAETYLAPAMLEEKGVLADIETQFLTADQRTRWMLLSAARLQQEAAVLTVIDVTARKRTEAALEESRRAISTLLSNLPGMAYRYPVDRRWRMEFVSEGSVELTGYEPDDLVENRTVAYADLIHPDDRERVWKDVTAALEAHRPFQLEYRIITRSGDERWIWEQGRGVYPRDDAYQAVEGFITDTTDQIRANRQLSIINQIISLSTTSATLETLVDESLKKTLEFLSMDAGTVFIVDPERKVAELVAHHDLPDAFLASHREVDISAEPYPDIFVRGISRYEETLPGRGEEAFRSCAAIPFTSDGEVVGAMVVFSRTPHRFSEDEHQVIEAIGREMGNAVKRALLQRELESAYEEANLYLDIMSHDINNANTASIGYAQLLIGTLGGKELDFGKKILASVQKSVEIIGNVSTIRKLKEERGGLKPIALDDVIRNEISRFPETRIRYAGTGLTVMADDLISEVFTNLIGNSIKFGGTDVEIDISVEERDGEARIEVADNGPGIPDEDKSEVFFRFRRGKSTTSGKGLGLYISRMLVERYGGRIWAEDRVPGHYEEGARMCMVLRTAPAP